MTKFLALATAFFLALNPFSQAFAKTLYVPKEYEKIQKAIDLSDKGDTIKVAPGIYYENIYLRDGRNLVGAGADKTIITDDEQGAPDPIVQIDGDCVLSDFTITGARGAGVGHAIMVTRGAPQILNNIVRDNSFTGIGIHSVTLLTTPLVSNNRIYGNGGAGIANLGEMAQATIRNNEVYSNTNAGIACTESALPIIEGNNIFGNGVGVATKEGAKSVIRGNTISRNKLVGVVVIKKSASIIDNNTIHENGTVGINIDGESNVWVIKNTIANNGTEAVGVKGKSKAYIAFNSISSNISVVLQLRNSAATVVRNQIVSSNDPSKILSTEYLESIGINLDHEHEATGAGSQSVVNVRSSSAIAVGGNVIYTGIDVDEKSTMTIIPPEKLPAKAENIRLPDYRKLVNKDTGTQEKVPTAKPAETTKPTPYRPAPKSFWEKYMGCLGVF